MPLRQSLGPNQPAGFLAGGGVYADHVRDPHQFRETGAPAGSDRDLHAGGQAGIMEGDLHAEGPRPGGRCQADAAKPHNPEVMAGSERRTGGPMVIGSPAGEPVFRLSFKSIQLMVMWFTVCCWAI